MAPGAREVPEVVGIRAAVGAGELEYNKLLSILAHEFEQDREPRAMGRCDYTFPDGDYCGYPVDYHPATLARKLYEARAELTRMSVQHEREWTDCHDGSERACTKSHGGRGEG